jgi:hypothetical protein
MKDFDGINGITFRHGYKTDRCAESGFGANDNGPIWIGRNCRNVKNYTINNISMGKYYFCHFLNFFFSFSIK